MKGTFTEAPIIWFLSTVVIRAPTLSRRKTSFWDPESVSPEDGLQISY